jgi:hypothetical protein
MRSELGSEDSGSEWGQVNCWPSCEVFVRNLGERLFDPLANAQVYEFDQDSEPHREIDVAFRDVLVETLSNWHHTNKGFPDGDRSIIGKNLVIGRVPDNLLNSS